MVIGRNLCENCVCGSFLLFLLRSHCTQTHITANESAKEYDCAKTVYICACVFCDLFIRGPQFVYAGREKDTANCTKEWVYFRHALCAVLSVQLKATHISRARLSVARFFVTRRARN